MIKKLGLILLVFLVVYPVLCRADDSGVEVEVEREQPIAEEASGPVNAESDTVWSESDEYGSNYTAADKSSLKETKFAFQAEINRLMSILVNSLYSNRDVFLRELISNASDALDKLRYMLLTKGPESVDEKSLKPQIRIWVDKEKRQLNILDTGIGMSKEELENNLGKIAKSGTSDFIQKLSLGGENLDSQIGQFGVGFYSAFLVANSVTVTTKSDGHPQYVWRSSDEDSGSYTIAEDPRKNTLKRGTLITLDLKKDASAYMSESKLHSLIHQYSEFINFPIYLRNSKVVSEKKDEGDAGAETPETPEKPEGPEEPKEEVDEDNEDEELESSMEVDVAGKKVMYSWELVNNQKPIWTRSPSQILDEEYDEFYKVLNKNDTKKPLKHIHFMAEGDHMFTCLLYIPASSPFNVFDHSVKYHNLRLHVKRVYITDSFDDVLPRYLAFLVGLVDSDNMPLNVSREVLQKHRLMNVIRRKIVNKVLATIEDMFENDRKLYDKFYLEYSANLKYGVVEDKKNSQRLMKLLLFNSYRHPKKQITLQQYVKEMPEGQKSIYYIGGESMKTIKGSPLIEPATKQGYDVLYLPSTIDAYTIEVSKSFRAEDNTTYKFVDMTKESDSISKEDKEMLENLEKGEYKPLLDFFSDVMKEHHIGSVKLTNRLHTTPCSLIASSNSYSANMERIIKAQYAETMTPLVMKALGKTFEFNIEHPIVHELLRLVKENETNTVSECLQLLYESAVITSGYSIDQPIEFSRRLHRLVGQNLRIPMDWSIEKMVEEEKDEEEDKSVPYDTIDADQEDQGQENDEFEQPKDGESEPRGDDKSEQSKGDRSEQHGDNVSEPQEGESTQDNQAGPQSPENGDVLLTEEQTNDEYNDEL